MYGLCGLCGGLQRACHHSECLRLFFGVKSAAAPYFRYEHLFLAAFGKIFSKLPVGCIPVSVAVGGDASAGSGRDVYKRQEEVNFIADNVIQFERTCVTGISAALGTPGGAAMAATIPADIIQYYGYMLRTAQKLMYLYGFPEINTNEKGQNFDSETLNILIVCLGVMYGVAGANNAIKAMAKALACGVEKKLIHAALTKGTIYPIVRSVAKWFGVKMTKEVFAGFFKKAIPVVGGVVGGGITYMTFKPCCDKLKTSLQDTLLSNPNHKETKEENIIIDVDYSSIVEFE